MAAALFASATSAQGPATRNAEPVRAAERSGRPFDAKFTDVTSQAGLAKPIVYGGEKTKRYILEANGPGAAFLDYDGDGWLDIFLMNGSKLEGAPESAVSRLYRNKRDGTFEDVTAQAGVGKSGWGGGVCAGDIDNDGHLDLYAAYWGPNSLYRNNGDGTFDDVAAKVGVAGRKDEWTSGCTFVDIDGDGHLDLLTTQYQQFDPKTAPPPGDASNCQWKGMPVFCGPRGLPYGGLTLYRNKGDGTFEDVSETSGVRETKNYYAFTAVTADFNRSGSPDIYVASDSTPNLFFVNNGDGTFLDFATETGVAFNEHGFEQGGMGVAVGDFDRDGWLDIVKTNFAGDYPNVYRNLGEGIFEDVVIRAGLAVNPQYVGWGVGLVDLDNDGWQDVFQVNGHVYPELDQQDRVRERYRQRNVVYRNLGDGKFEDVTGLVGPGLEIELSSRGAAFGDFNNDGGIDAVVVNMGAPPTLLRNDLPAGPERRWTIVQLEGTASNRSAIGATVQVHAGGVIQTRAILSQDSFLSHSDLRAHFGLGKAERIEKFAVTWPNGEREEFPGVGANRIVRLVEGSGKTEEVRPK